MPTLRDTTKKKNRSQYTDLNNIVTATLFFRKPFSKMKLCN